MALNAAETYVQNKLSTNNSAVSSMSDKLMSFLEGADGDIRIRHLINEELRHIALDCNLSAEELFKRKSLKDKIAFLASGQFNGRVIPINQEVIDKRRHDIIISLEQNLLKNSDFTESFMIRNAALNRFECALSKREETVLNTKLNELLVFCRQHQLTDMENALDLKDESDAQKIYKLRETVRILEKRGVAISKAFLDAGYDMLVGKIEKLDNLDRSYKDMNVALNQSHEVARHCFTINSPLSQSQTEKFLAALKKTEAAPKDVINGFFARTEGKDYLERYLNGLSVLDKDTQRELKISQDEFRKYFLIHFSGEILKESKLRFDSKKSDAFRHRIKLFEQDINNWRGIARDRVMELHIDSVATRDEVAYDALDSYFEKFQTLFYGDKDAGSVTDRVVNSFDDLTGMAYGRNRSPQNAYIIRNALRGILGRRYEELGTHRSGIIRRNDLDRLTDFFMDQNWTVNELFFNDKNPFVEEEGNVQRVFKVVGRTEEYRKDVRDVVMPYVHTTLRFLEETVKKVGNVAAWAGKTATKVASVPTEGFNKFIETKAEGGFIKKNLTRVAKITGVLWPITKTIEKLSKGTHSLISGTEDATKKVYDAALDTIRKTSGENVNHTYEGATLLLDGLLSIAGKSTSWLGNFSYDRLNTSQKRNFVSAVYKAAGSEEELKRWLKTADLGNMLDIRSSSAYLFDEDGRIDNFYDGVDLTGKKLRTTSEEETERQERLARRRSRTTAAAPDSAAPDSAAPDSAAPDSAAPDSAAPDANVLTKEEELYETYKKYLLFAGQKPKDINNFNVNRRLVKQAQIILDILKNSSEADLNSLVKSIKTNFNEKIANLGAGFADLRSGTDIEKDSNSDSWIYHSFTKLFLERKIKKVSDIMGNSKSANDFKDEVSKNRLGFEIYRFGNIAATQVKINEFIQNIDDDKLSDMSKQLIFDGFKKNSSDSVYTEIGEYMSHVKI